MPFSQEYIMKLQKLFAHLHVHSEYSNLRLLDSTNKIINMIKYVVSLGQNSLGLTDHESLSGHIEFLTTVEQLKKDGIIPQDFKPILGNEIYLVDEETMITEVEDKESKPKFYHFILLAKDKVGHNQLRKLSTLAWTRMFSYKGMERVPTFYSDFENVLGNDKGHLIASTACLGSYFADNIAKILSSQDDNKIKQYKTNIHEFITWCKGTFGQDDFYIEIQPSLMEEQISYNKYAIMIAKAYGIKHVIMTDAHYLASIDRMVHEAYLTSDSDGESTREVGAFYSSTHFFTGEHLFENLNYLSPQDIETGMTNSREISDKVEIYSLAHKQIIPKIELPKESSWVEYRDLYTYVKDSEFKWINILINSSEVYDRYLVNKIFEGVELRIKKDEYRDTFTRINTECKEIVGASVAKEEPLSSYFITMQKNIEIMWNEANSIVMPGRGSAGAFIIDYLLNITQVNPLKQPIELPHWRFISAERPDYPDIDIDVPSHKKVSVFQKISAYYESIGGTIVRVCTFGTETSRSAIKTACRGLDINTDVALHLTSLIPVERGTLWSLHDCYYGDKKVDRLPIAEFIKIVNTYGRLLEVALGIENLINKRSSHPCGIVIVNEDITKYNALMRTPSGELVTQYNLQHTEYMGGLKYDFLNTKTASMIQITLELLVEYGKIEWQGSLQKTYDKYLHPDTLDTTSKELWDLLNSGDLISAFQFDSAVGEKAINAIKPQNLTEAIDGNNLMRLMGESNQESPMDRYVRYKNDINEWYKDMQQFGLNEDEMGIMKDHLSINHGVCSTQEGMMMLSMDKRIANFNVVESNILRKGVAKKLGSMYEKAHKLLYDKGIDNETSTKLLDYVWDVQIAMQRGYGFSTVHSLLYTYILLQQLNLGHYFPIVYWNTAVLLVESGSLDEDEAFDSTKKSKATNYGTVAKAIGNMKSKGINITLPDINKSKLGYQPNEEEDEIIFGLKGVISINQSITHEIINSRPYISLQDFHEKLVLKKKEVTLTTGKVQNKSLVPLGSTISLIKAGAFDMIENSKPRVDIMNDYLKLNFPDRLTLDLRAVESVSDLGIVPEQHKLAIRINNFKNYITNKENFIKDDKESKTKKWYVLKGHNELATQKTINFFEENFMGDMTEDKDYYYDEIGNIVFACKLKSCGFEKTFDKLTSGLKQWLKSDDCLNRYNEFKFGEVCDKYAKGSISKWEMDSLSFYYHEHELAKVDKEKYFIKDFSTLPEETIIERYGDYKGRPYPIYKLDRIAGTVLDKDKNKHMVTILTINGEVVTLKFYSGQFGFYDKTISQQHEDGTKTTIEDSWFKRGNLILASGFRNGEMFKSKKYKDSAFQHSLALVTDIREDGILELKTDRAKV